MAHELPKLPYDFSALEPHIDAQTMQIHHGKHHQTYVNNLNAALEKHPDLQGKSIEDLCRGINKIPEEIRTAVRNNGGGHLNHTLFWESMGPDGGGAPDGDLAAAVDDAFGSFSDFQAKLKDAGVNQFGSGWAWLVSKGGKLDVIGCAQQDSPIMDGSTPIFGIDVWEHAYYLKYKNKRPDYIAAWWNTLNWDEINNRFKSA